MDSVLEYMINRKWENIDVEQKIVDLNRMADQGMKSDMLSNKIGSVLIYNQVVEQFLKDIILCSIGYIKAEIWPTSVQFGVDLEKMTFGTLIECYKQYALKEYNRDVIICCLKKLNAERNEVVHKLFSVDDLNELDKKMIAYGELANETIKLLVEYYNCVINKLYELRERVDFSDLV